MITWLTTVNKAAFQSQIQRMLDVAVLIYRRVRVVRTLIAVHGTISRNEAEATVKAITVKTRRGVSISSAMHSITVIGRTISIADITSTLSRTAMN